MASGDRFYQFELTHRAALMGDVGSLIKIEGLLVGGEDMQALLLLPEVSVNVKNLHALELSPENWTDYLQRSDNPEVLVMPAKAFHRKVRYEISGLVQQKVWLADGLQCVYCKAPMGKAQLTIDHFYPLESGGANDVSNYLTACRRCNKDKGAMPPQLFCQKRGLVFDLYVSHLSTRRV